MFKTLRFSLQYDFLRFGHLNFRNLVIVSNFDIRISYFPACPGYYTTAAVMSKRFLLTYWKYYTNHAANIST